MSPLPPLSPRNRLVNARKSIYITIHNKRYMLVPLFNRNGKLIRAQKVNLNKGSPYRARAMHEIFPPTPKKRRLASPKRAKSKTPPRPKAKSKTPNKLEAFVMPAFPGWK